MDNKIPTFGQKRVRVSFNPDGNAIVHSIKQKAAELIDEIKDLQTCTADRHELDRLKSLAMTEIESAVHWAVKAATYK